MPGSAGSALKEEGQGSGRAAVAELRSTKRENQMQISLDDIRRALSLPDFDAGAAQAKMTPAPRAARRPESVGGRPRQGAVLVLLYAPAGEMHLVLTQRRPDLNAHAGQISFPGGRVEDGESPLEAALREAQEEVGVEPAELEVLGSLAPLYIPPSDYAVQPFVAWHGGRPVWRPQEREVAAIIEAPLIQLLDPANRREEEWELRGYRVLVPFVQLGPYQVWGATAMILSEFLERVRRARKDEG